MKTKKLAANLRNSRGQAIAELAFTFAILSFMFLGFLDFSRIFYTQLATEFAINEGARYGSLGTTQGPFTRVESIKNRTQKVAERFGIQIDSIRVSASQVEDSAGQPGEFFSIEVDERVDLGPVLSHMAGSFINVNSYVEARNEFFAG